MPDFTEIRDATQIAPAEHYLLRRRGLWWRPDAAGYTDQLVEAGIYTGTMAAAYVSGTRGDREPVTAVTY